MGKSNSKAASNGEANYKGKKFNKAYMLARELGSGAFSIVKLGVNKSTGENVAVKIVSKKKLSDEDLTALHCEIKILTGLDHPHIIKLFEVFEEGTEFYIVTELVQGGELFDRIVSKSHYTEKEARDLVKLFLETMAYMHEADVVHRDLKPENLLLTSEDDDADIKIADFGFAKKISELEQQEVACGTPGYVAPEILRGDPYGAEVDIWSMGVICYVLLAGYPPFYDEDQKKLFKKIKEAKYYFHEDYWSHISEEAMDLIRKMLCLDQAQRWTARQLLSHPWITAGDEVLEGRDITGSLTEMKRYNARRKLKAAADAVIMANRISRLTGGIRAAAAESEEEVPLDDGPDIPAPQQMKSVAEIPDA
mmetsp:Transcript_6791/g.14531  ORF Transcript_6791/g.14531 Transcript_6791/m.14531 type:complete len:365 (+) Transcript_6791:34-1128(+)